MFAPLCNNKAPTQGGKNLTGGAKKNLKRAALNILPPYGKNL